MLIDTHCHLDADEFASDRDAVIARASDAGVAAIVVPAIAVANFEAVRGLAHAVPGVHYALGIHPLYVRDADEEDLARLREAATGARDDPRFVAIGEIGLDLFESGHDPVRQERFFAEQLRLARDLGLPVLMHVRRAQDLVLKHLRRIRPVSGIAHAFNGSLQQASRFLEFGVALGIGGAMTYDRALQIRRLVAELPADAFVLETDAPDIPPAWIARERNEPAHLARIASEFALLRAESVERAVARTAANAQRVLPRLAP